MSCCRVVWSCGRVVVGYGKGYGVVVCGSLVWDVVEMNRWFNIGFVG